MKNLKLITLAFSLLIAINVAFAQSFNINGSVTGLADGTWLYLRTASPEKILDSTQVKEGKFNLIGNTNEKISQLGIYTEKYKNYVFFWAEQNTHLQLKDGEFKKAIISGSKTHIEDEALKAKLREVNQLQESLSNSLKGKKGGETKEIWDKLKEARLKERSIYEDYIITNPNSLVAANILNIYSSTWGKETTNKLYQNLSDEMKSTSYGKSIKDFISLNQDIKIGGKFADFEQANTLGKKVKLSDIKAKYILLEFWGSWCGPCRDENPNLVKTYNNYKNKGFEILGVAAEDNKNKWLKAIKDDKLPWENVSDLKGDKNEAALIYGVFGYPTNYLINENGIIIAKNLRGEALNKKLAELLH